MRCRLQAAAWAAPLLCVLYLFSPAPPGEICGEWVSFGDWLGLAYNCDSPHFVLLSREPARVFREGETRQSRPGYVLTTAALVHPVLWGAELLRVPLDEDRRYRIGIVVLTALNFLLLGMTLRLLAGLLLRHGASLAWVGLAGVAVAVNDVTKAFVWTPHQQILNLLVPVVGLVALDRLVGRRDAAAWRVAALLAGAGALAYGTFFVVVGALAVLRAYEAVRDGRRLLAAAAEAGVLLLLGLAPALLWMAGVRLAIGSFYSHETTAYRQVVWILDAAREGTEVLVAEAVRRTAGLGRTFLSLEIVPFLGLAAAGLAMARARRARLPAPVGQALLLVATSVAFFAAVGQPMVRLSFATVPALLVVAALSFSAAGLRLDRLRGRIPALALALGWITLHVAKAGPYG